MTRVASDLAWEPGVRVDEIGRVGPEEFAARYAGEYRPVVMRGLAGEWPLVAAAREGAATAVRHVASFYRGAPVKLMRARAEEGGRYFYAPDLRGYNFRVEQASLASLLDELMAQAGDAQADSLYAGSSPTDQHLPGFAGANPLPLATPGASPRIWVGNASHVSPHYDVSDNIAVVGLGHRRFVLFPPDQTPNLYVGPLDVTIAGQPVSMVDLRRPDLNRFPRYRRAMDAALVADLEPGDAIFVPTLWWHGVIARDPVNILVNYWYNQPPDGSPFAALLHAMLAIRDLRPGQKAALRTWFEAYVFADDAGARGDHLPPYARGVIGPRSRERTAAIRRFLLQAVAPPR